MAFGPYLYFSKAPFAISTATIFMGRPLCSLHRDGGSTSESLESAALSEWRFKTSFETHRAAALLMCGASFHNETVVAHIFKGDRVLWMLVLCEGVTAPHELHGVSNVHSVAAQYCRWCGPIVPPLQVDIGRGGSQSAQEGEL